MTSITQDMKYRLSLIRYAEKLSFIPLKIFQSSCSNTTTGITIVFLCARWDGNLLKLF